jgi:hypothetical protein
LRIGRKISNRKETDYKMLHKDRTLRALVSTLMNFKVPMLAVDFLTMSTTLSFWRNLGDGLNCLSTLASALV